MWQVIKKDRQKHTHMLKEALEKILTVNSAHNPANLIYELKINKIQEDLDLDKRFPPDFVLNKNDKPTIIFGIGFGGFILHQGSSRSLIDAQKQFQ